MNETLILDGATYDGRGGELKLVTSEHRAAVILTGEKPVLRNVTVVMQYNGDGSTWNPPAVRVEGAENPVIENCTFVSNHGDGLYVEDVEALVVDNTTMKGGRNGCSIVNAAFVAMGYCTYESLNLHNPMFGLDVEPNRVADRVQDIVISNPVFVGSRAAHIGVVVTKTEQPWDVTVCAPNFGPQFIENGLPTTYPWRFVKKDCKAPGRFVVTAGGKEISRDEILGDST